MILRYALGLALLALLAPACSDSNSTPPRDGDVGTTPRDTGPRDSPSSSGDFVADASPFAGMTLPDPGSGAADWENTEFEAHETPDKAWKVGVVTQNSPYVTVDMHPSGRAYLVFRTGPSFTRFDVDLGGSTNTVNPAGIHLHDGAGLKFGAAVRPISATSSTGAWTVQPDHVYVLEIVTPGAGFV